MKKLTSLAGVPPIPPREPSGRPQRDSSAANQSDPGARNKWRRLRDNRASMLRLGGRDHWATVLGRLMAEQHVTELQYESGKRYAEVVGRYHRFHPPTTAVHAKSPAYERGRGGQDDEIERRLKNGTIADYEVLASRARDKLHKIESKFADRHERELVFALCVCDEEIPAIDYPKVASVLERFRKHWGYKE